MPDSRAPQGRADQVGVVRRVRQKLRGAIARVSDHQRDAPIQRLSDNLGLTVGNRGRRDPSGSWGV
jgi:hypothetical protein